LVGPGTPGKKEGIMGAVLKWPWSLSLAMAREGDVLEVREVLFGSIRDHLWGVGVRKGAKLEYLGRDDEAVAVRLPDGNGVKVARDHAWFVVVERDDHRNPKQE
jgi:hypothetical protein